MGYVKTAAAAVAFYFLTSGAQAAGGSFAKQEGNRLFTEKKHELALPKNMKRFSDRKPLADSLKNGEITIPADSNYNGNVISLIDSAGQITPGMINFSDSTSSLDSSNNAKDSSISKKKKLRKAQNPLGVNLDDFFALSPDDRTAYADSLKAKMGRLLQHKKYKNDTRETYREWLAGFESFMQNELLAYQNFVQQGNEIEKANDSLRMANQSDTLRLLPEEFVLELIRLFPESDGSRSDAFFKRQIAYNLLEKHAELVKAYDLGQIGTLDSALAGRIDLAYEKVCDSTHNSHSSKRNANVKFRDLLMYYVYDACANESYGSYKMSIDVMSSLTPGRMTRRRRRR